MWTALLLALLLVLYAGTARSIVDVWSRSNTFAHGFLIPPIVAWLIWRRRREIERLVPRPNAWGVPLLLLLGALWLTARVGSFLGIEQAAFALMLPAAILAMLGGAVVRALAFPLAFSLLAVPTGEALEAPLMALTTWLTVKALQVTGVPVYVEGNFLYIPGGRWSVTEACSGLRYLMASLTLGTLYAYLSFPDARRRARFILLSAFAPLAANGVRAYLIVMLGYLSGMKLATGVDHIIYGWFLFAVVMGIVFWIGSRWRDRGPEGPDRRPAAEAREAISAAPPREPAPSRPATARRLAAVGSAALVASACVPLLAWSRERSGTSGPVTLEAPEVPGWRPVLLPAREWEPEFTGEDARIAQAYENGRARVHLEVRYYAREKQGKELISWENQLVRSNNRVWRRAAERPRAVAAFADSIRVRETLLRSDAQSFLAWHWFWVGGRSTESRYQAKVLQLLARLGGEGRGAALVVVATPYTKNLEADQAALQSFLSAVLASLERSLRDPRPGGAVPASAPPDTTRVLGG